jgi:hypothetical protein
MLDLVQVIGYCTVWARLLDVAHLETDSKHLRGRKACRFSSFTASDGGCRPHKEL